MDHLLTDEEIAKLTGVQRGADKQKRILERHGVGYIEGFDGKPRTTWEAVNAALVARGRRPVEDEPNWDALKKAS